MGKRLAAAVKQARHQNGLSLRVTAKAGGISKGTIEAIERGQTQRPERQTFTGLARALGLHERDLILPAALDALDEWAAALGVSPSSLLDLLQDFIEP